MTDIFTCVARVEALCGAFGIDSLRPQIAALGDARRDSGVVDVAVLGQFKAGKSSFLNAVIGRDVMPVDVLPATAVITRVGYGPADRVQVRRFSGAVDEVPPGRLAEFVTEQGNPGNGKQVAMVEVELAALAPYKGVRFVDTPGLGSVFAHNTKVSLDWLPRVGGALVAVSVNHPLSGQDLQLLRDVARHTPEIAILLTKTDLVPEAQVDAVVDFTRRQVVRHMGKEIPIFPFSVHPAFGAVRGGVRDHLLHHLAGRHEEKFEEIMAHKVRALIAGCREYLLLAQGAAAAAEKARSDLESVLLAERREIRSVQAEIALFARELSSRVRTVSGERFLEYHREVVARLREAAVEKMPGWTGNLSRTTEAFREWLAAALTEELGRLSEHGEAHLGGFLFKARASFQRTVRAFQDRLAKEIERALGIAFSGAHFDARIDPPERPDVRVGKTFDIHIDLLWFMIPMTVFGPLVRRHFVALIPWEAEKNLSRLAGQWADAVNASIDSLARQAADFIQGELSTIERLVGAAGDRRAEIAAALGELGELEDGPART